MRLRRPLFAIVTAAALAAGAITVGVPASATNATPSTSTNGFTPDSIHWKNCAKKYSAGFQCGSLAVPLDWANPDGGRITLALTRIKHTAKPYQGVMLVNPGGPGGSGLSLPVLKKYVPNGAGDGYDWIGFDPRGVGESTPSIHCIDDYANGVRPPYEPTTTAIEHAWLKRTHKYVKACDRRNGAILEHMTTADAAKDMDAIRVALGQEQINYYGFSYGTYLGQVYATLFPDRTRRLVFDGTVDPRKIWYQANLDQDVAFEKSMAVWFAWIAKYNRVYHLGTTAAKVEARYYKVKAKLTKKPVGDVGPSEWNDMLLYAGYYQSTWTELAQVFSDYAVKGDKKALQQGYEDNVASDDDNGFAVYSAVQCTDAAWPDSYESYKADNWATFKKAPFETWGNAWFNAPCLWWPAASGTPVEIDGSRTPSVLMINETLDAATPYPGSIEVRRRFPNARLITEPGGTTHAGSLYGNACVDDRIAAYLQDGTLPDRQAGDRGDVYCKPLPQPVPTGAKSSGSGSGSQRGTVLALLNRARGGLIG